MSKMSGYVRLLATSTYLPGEKIKFDDINKYLGEFTSAPMRIRKWVERSQPIMKEMLGVEYCHFAYNNKTKEFDDDNLSMSVKVAQKALVEANLSSNEIDLLIYAGAYSHQLPPLSARIQAGLGIKLCAEMHIHSNCSSVYKAIKVAETMLKSGEYKKALVVSSIVTSSCFTPEYYNQGKVTKEDIFLRWYLCDGAGAFVLSYDDEPENGFYIEDTYLESCGDKSIAMGNAYPNLWRNPIKSFDNCEHHISQLYVNKMNEDAIGENGKTIYYDALCRMIKAKNIDPNELTRFVINMPSKAIRQSIIDECVDLGIEREKFYSGIEKIGYTGPPAALISIDTLLKSQQFKDRDLVLSFVMEVSKFMQAGFSLRYYM